MQPSKAWRGVWDLILSSLPVSEDKIFFPTVIDATKADTSQTYEEDAGP